MNSSPAREVTPWSQVFLILLGIAGFGLAIWASETWGHLVPQRVSDMIRIGSYAALWGWWLWRRKVKKQSSQNDGLTGVLFGTISFVVQPVLRLFQGF